MNISVGPYYRADILSRPIALTNSLPWTHCVSVSTFNVQVTFHYPSIIFFHLAMKNCGYIGYNLRVKKKMRDCIDRNPRISPRFFFFIKNNQCVFGSQGSFLGAIQFVRSIRLIIKLGQSLGQCPPSIPQDPSLCWG